MTDPAFIVAVLRLTSEHDDCDLFWRVEGDAVKFFAMCSDVFSWGSADCEEITPENLSILEASYQDIAAIDGCLTGWAKALFAARVRGMRPQGAAYPKEDLLWPLFDACGPGRLVGLGNPSKHPASVVTP